MLFIRLCQLPLDSLIESCELLKDEFDITVYMPDEGFGNKYSQYFSLNYVPMPFIKKERVRGKLNSFLNLLSYFINIRKNIKNFDYDLIIVYSQKWAVLAKLLLGKKSKYVMQTYTRGVSKNKLSNIIHKNIVRFNISHFKHVLIPIEYNIDYFKIPSEKIYHNKLSYRGIAYVDRSFIEMNLVYLGTLTNRNIHETVLAFEKFFYDYRDKIKMSYTIIGSGKSQDIEMLHETISNCINDLPVSYLGRLDDGEVKKIFEKTNIGVFYCKATEYFIHNVPSKMHQYLLSGMPVISTFTDNSKEVIDDSNGIIIESSKNGFYQGLAHIYNNLDNYNSMMIADSDKEYSKEYVTINYTIPMIKKIIRGKV